LATKRPPRKTAKARATKRLPVKPLPCSRLFEFFKNVTVGPGQNYDSTTPQNVDCYQWLHVWVLAQHPNNFAMDNVSVELVFELPGNMGATGLANLAIAYNPGVRPTPLEVGSGPQVGGYGGFVIRAPVIGPGVRAIVINNGAQTYDFTLWGYATH
jgi:hypothetical protein